MKILGSVILLVVLSLYSCKDKETSNPIKVVLEQNDYCGLYSVIRTELVGFEADMTPIVKYDTFFYDDIRVTYSRRADSIFISSGQFAYCFETENNGTAGELYNSLSSFTYAGTRFELSDSNLVIDGYSQQGSRIQITRKFNGRKE